MHDPTDRNTNSMMSASPNRLLNLHLPKLSRPSSQQQNLAKKMKTNHINGARPTTQEGTSTVRSLFINKFFLIKKLLNYRFKK